MFSCFRNIFIIFVSVPIFIFSLSCGKDSDSDSQTGYSLDPLNMSAASTVTALSSSFSVNSVGSGARAYGVITQNSTQTGISLASYNNDGTEETKIVFYVNQGSGNGYALPTTTSTPVAFSAAATGSYIAKYDDDNNNSTAMAMIRTLETATISFTVEYISSGIYTLTACSVPNLSGLSTTTNRLVRY